MIKKRKNKSLPQTEDCSLGRLLSAFWQFLGLQRKRYVALAVFCTLSAIVVTLLPTMGLGHLNTLFQAKHKDERSIALLIAAIALVSLVFGMINRAMNRKLLAISDRVLYETRLSGYSRLMAQSYQQHLTELAGQKIQRINQGIADLQTLLKFLSGPIFNLGSTVIGVFIIFAVLSPIFIPTLLVIFTLVYASERIFYSAYREAQHKRTKARERSSGTFTEAITNVYTIKALGAEKGLRIAIEQSEGEGLIASKEVLAVSAKKSIGFQLTKSVSMYSTLTLIAHLIFTGQLAQAFALAYVMYYMRMFNNADELTDVINEIIRIRVGVSRMLTIYDMEDPPDGTKKFPTDWKTITFDNVSFAYPGNERERLALHEVNITIKRGQRIGITGPTGSGKSTLTKLLHGLYEPTLGGIRVDDLPFGAITNEERAAHITGVPQETQLFNTTFALNITLFEVPDPERLRNAIELAQLTPVIESLPDGVETIIGEQGHDLSGGQRQRLSLARAVYHQGEFVILDEATSNLDYGTEENVQSALNKDMLGRTLLINAHRLKTLRDTDWIYVLDKGEIIEQGTFAELEERVGGYIHQLSQAERIAAAHH